MNKNDDKQLWDLLGKAGNTSPNPMFTQNVLRAIRQEEARQEEKSPWWKTCLDLFTRSTPRKLATGMTAIAALFLCYGILPSSVESPASYSQELAAVEATVQALQGDTGDTSGDSNSTLVEMASCYTDDMSDDEMAYLLANL